MKAHHSTTPTATDAQALGIERTAYMAGWWYGVVCGLICGASTTALALLLLHLAAQAWVAAPAAKAVSLLGVTT